MCATACLPFSNEYYTLLTLSPPSLSPLLHQSIFLILQFSWNVVAVAVTNTFVYRMHSHKMYIAVFWTAEQDCMSEHQWTLQYLDNYYTLYDGNDSLLLLLLLLLSLHFDIYMNFRAMCVFSCHQSSTTPNTLSGIILMAMWKRGFKIRCAISVNVPTNDEIYLQYWKCRKAITVTNSRSNQHQYTGKHCQHSNIIATDVRNDLQDINIIFGAFCLREITIK